MQRNFKSNVSLASLVFIGMAALFVTVNAYSSDNSNPQKVVCTLVGSRTWLEVTEKGGRKNLKVWHYRSSEGKDILTNDFSGGKIVEWFNGKDTLSIVAKADSKTTVTVLADQEKIGGSGNSLSGFVSFSAGMNPAYGGKPWIVKISCSPNL